MQIDFFLYEKILQVMPIPCVDIVLVNDDDEILLVLRANKPAQGKWWFPGGRVYFGETRKNAVKRKLFEECGYELDADPVELGTYDSLLAIDGERVMHGITTLFKINVKKSFAVILDEQSIVSKWEKLEYWVNSGIDPFVEHGIKEAIKNR